MSAASFQVFISHSSKDKPYADAVCSTLEYYGVKCWVAPRDVPPGQPWAAAIAHAVETCKIMVLVFSEQSNQSQEVEREVAMAAKYKHAIIPFRIQNVVLSKSLEYYISNTHWLDALTDPMEEHLLKLARVVCGYLDKRLEPNPLFSGLQRCPSVPNQPAPPAFSQP